MSLALFSFPATTLFLPSITTSLNSTRIAKITPICSIPSAFLDESRIPSIPTRTLTIHKTDVSLSSVEYISALLAEKTSADFTVIIVHIPNIEARETTHTHSNIASTLAIALTSAWKRASEAMSLRRAWRRWRKRTGRKTTPELDFLIFFSSWLDAAGYPWRKVRRDLILDLKADEGGGSEVVEFVDVVV